MTSENVSQTTTAAVAPTVDPSYLDSLPNAFRLWANAVRMNIDVCLPCEVIKYDRATHTATVGSLILRQAASDGQTFARAPFEVTVWRFQAGGFVIDAPVAAGDTGWVIASDRNGAAAKRANAQTDAEGPTAVTNGDRTTHLLECGFFVPDRWGEIDLAKAGFGEGELVFASVSEGAAKGAAVSLGADGFTVVDVNAENDGRRAVIDPKGDLDKTDARFREITVLTGFREKTSDNKVKLTAQKARILADEAEDVDDVVFDVGKGGGGGGENETLTLKYGDDDPVEYDGSEPKTFAVPEPTPNRSFSLDGEEVSRFLGTDNIEIDAQEPTINGISLGSFYGTRASEISILAGDGITVTTVTAGVKISLGEEEPTPGEEESTANCNLWNNDNTDDWGGETPGLGAIDNSWYDTDYSQDTSVGGYGNGNMWGVDNCTDINDFGEEKAK